MDEGRHCAVRSDWKKPLVSTGRSGSLHTGTGDPVEGLESPTVEQTSQSVSSNHDIASESIGPDKLEASARNRPSCEAPYCWQSRRALDQINKNLGTQAANGLAVYLALCRLSSERQNSSVITAKIEVIASLAGLRYRKTQQVLHDLETAKVIEIQNPNPAGKRPNKPCGYQILPHVSGRRSARDTGKHSMPTEGCTGEQSSRAGSPKGNLQKDFQKKKETTSRFAQPAPGGGQAGDVSTNNHNTDPNAPW